MIGSRPNDRDTMVSSPNSSMSRDTYTVQSNIAMHSKKKDIEEEDYIYKVPCDPRQTISLRDSVKLNRPSPDTLKKQQKKKSKNHTLAEGEQELDSIHLASTAHASDRELAPTKLNNPIPRKGTFTKKNLNIAIPADENGT